MWVIRRRGIYALAIRGGSLDCARFDQSAFIDRTPRRPGPERAGDSTDRRSDQPAKLFQIGVAAREHDADAAAAQVELAFERRGGAQRARRLDDDFQA